MWQSQIQNQIGNRAAKDHGLRQRDGFLSLQTDHQDEDGHKETAATETATGRQRGAKESADRSQGVFPVETRKERTTMAGLLALAQLTGLLGGAVAVSFTYAGAEKQELESIVIKIVKT